MLEGERSFDLVVKMAPRTVTDIPSIRNLPVFGSNGERLTLGDLATVEAKPGMARIYREENERRTDIKLSIRDREMGSVVADAQRAISTRIKVPSGYHIVWTGSFENERRAERRLAIIFTRLDNIPFTPNQSYHSNYVMLTLFPVKRLFTGRLPQDDLGAGSC